MPPITDAPLTEAADSAAMLIPIILAALAVMGGMLAWLIRTMVGRVMTDLDARFDRMEQRMTEVDKLESEFARLRAELPLHYQRRDDSIREYTAMNAKLDRIYELIMESRRD
ncbi:MAG: hypothetical protein AB1412_05325 [Pseudomonadota bacterium]